MIVLDDKMRAQTWTVTDSVKREGSLRYDTVQLEFTGAQLEAYANVLVSGVGEPWKELGVNSPASRLVDRANQVLRKAGYIHYLGNLGGRGRWGAGPKP